MATIKIKEAYVSFEVAKLLKEKGFDEYCLKNYWSSDKELHDWKWELSYNLNSGGNRNTKDCAAPTQQMAMAWLREAHNISVEPFIDWGSGDDYWWTVDITKIKKNGLITELSGYKSCEEAVEAALKYCLENLI